MITWYAIRDTSTGHLVEFSRADDLSAEQGQEVINFTFALPMMDLRKTTSLYWLDGKLVSGPSSTNDVRVVRPNG